MYFVRVEDRSFGILAVTFVSFGCAGCLEISPRYSTFQRYLVELRLASALLGLSTNLCCELLCDVL